jgi:hypothetical protein
MADIDFFVHPGFVFLTNAEQDKEKFLNSIVSLIYESSLSVLVHPLIRYNNSDYAKVLQAMNDKFQEIAPDATHLYSNSLEQENYAKLIPYGHVHHSSWNKLKFVCEDISINDDIRIHGCWYGQCTQNLAIQLYGLLKGDKHIFDWKEQPTQRDILFEKVLIYWLEKKEELKKTHIRYGITFTPDSKESQQQKLENLEAKSLDEQLTDKHTVIYGMR